MENFNNLKVIFEDYLLSQIPNKRPQKLYQPLHYILQNGGKRIRPLLVLLTAKSFNKNLQEALPGAAAIEIFHNFTLIHDDIMDKADIRRGQPSVHKKWDENIAILSGDTMMILAFKILEAYPPVMFQQLTSLLSKTALEICEGQQMDMDFENKDYVDIAEYLEMIRLKTAVLLGTAFKFGSLIGESDEESRNNFYEFGVRLGLAFQIQDDYLDVNATTKKFGKKIGGDILDKKKTFLYITALNNASQEDKKRLIEFYHLEPTDKKKHIEQVLSIFDKYDTSKITQEKISTYTQEALSFLNKVSIPDKEKEFWKNFSLQLMNRTY